MTESICANCGEPVVFMEAPPSLDPSFSYWTHRDRVSNWCYDPSGYLNPDLSMENRHKRAEPADA